METEAVDRYCYKSAHPKKQEERYNEHSRGLSTYRSEFDPKVSMTASEPTTHEDLGSLMRRETLLI